MPKMQAQKIPKTLSLHLRLIPDTEIPTLNFKKRIKKDEIFILELVDTNLFKITIPTMYSIIYIYVHL